MVVPKSFHASPLPVSAAMARVSAIWNYRNHASRLGLVFPLVNSLPVVELPRVGETRGVSGALAPEKKLHTSGAFRTTLAMILFLSTRIDVTQVLGICGESFHLVELDV